MQTEFNIVANNLSLMIYMFLGVLFLYSIVQILFILSSTSLIDVLKIKNQENITSKTLCWIQLLPIINYIGLFLYCKNMKEQYETFIIENPEKHIHKFKQEYGYILVISAILSLITYGNESITNLFSFCSFIMFIATWVNIVKVKNSVLKATN